MKALRNRLRRLREKLWSLVRRRHDAKPGGDRRDKLAEEVRDTRLRKDRLLQKIKDQKPVPSAGTVVIDGKPVASWIAKDILEARRRGLWDGYVVSGYRSPEYSESICYGMCGAPTCPGRCAGRGSAHSQLVYPQGAVDVDLARRDQFANAMRTIGSVLKNAMPTTDPNHFSASGH